MGSIRLMNPQLNIKKYIWLLPINKNSVPVKESPLFTLYSGCWWFVKFSNLLTSPTHDFTSVASVEEMMLGQVHQKAQLLQYNTKICSCRCSSMAFKLSSHAPTHISVGGIGWLRRRVAAHLRSSFCSWFPHRCTDRELEVLMSWPTQQNTDSDLGIFSGLLFWSAVWGLLVEREPTAPDSADFPQFLKRLAIILPVYVHP